MALYVQPSTFTAPAAFSKPLGVSRMDFNAYVKVCTFSSFSRAYLLRPPFRIAVWDHLLQSVLVFCIFLHLVDIVLRPITLTLKRALPRSPLRPLPPSLLRPYCQPHLQGLQGPMLRPLQVHRLPQLERQRVERPHSQNSPRLRRHWQASLF